MITLERKLTVVASVYSSKFLAVLSMSKVIGGWQACQKNCVKNCAKLFSSCRSDWMLISGFLLLLSTGAYGTHWNARTCRIDRKKSKCVINFVKC